MRSHIFSAIFSPLHSAGAVAAHELRHVGNIHAVEVADDRVLQAARRHGKLQRGLLVLIVVQSIDQAARKAVAAAHTVDDVQVISSTMTRWAMPI